MNASVKFDANDGGAFTVVEGSLQRAPDGWVEQSPGRFVPEKWPPCRYRRLSKRVVNGELQITPFCLLANKHVDYGECATCTVHQPEIVFAPITDEVRGLLDTGQPVPHELVEELCPECAAQGRIVDDPVFGITQEEEPMAKSTGGAGTELKRILASWGINASDGCKCIERANEMDRKGTAWCRANVDTIVGRLEEEAKRRSWPMRLFARFGARRVVLQAIEAAEAKN
jgi:hypothetical protein